MRIVLWLCLVLAFSACDNMLDGEIDSDSTLPAGYYLSIDTELPLANQKLEIRQDEQVGVRATLFDNNNQPVPNAEITWSIRQGSGNLTSLSSLQNNQSQSFSHRFQPSSSGTVIVRAESKDVSAELEIDIFALDQLFPMLEINAPINTLNFIPGQNSAYQLIEKLNFSTIYFYPTISAANNSAATSAQSSVQPLDLLPVSLGRRNLYSVYSTDDGSYTIAELKFPPSIYRELYSIRNSDGLLTRLHAPFVSGSGVEQSYSKVIGDQVFFMVNDGTDYSLYRAPVDGSGPETLVFQDILYNSINYSEDGSRILVKTARDNPGSDRYEPYLYIIGTDSTVQLNATDLGVVDTNILVRFFDNDERIIFASKYDSGSNPEIFICDNDGGNLNKLATATHTDSGLNIGQIAVASDDTLFFTSDLTTFGDFRLYSIPLSPLGALATLSPEPTGTGSGIVFFTINADETRVYMQGRMASVFSHTLSNNFTGTDYINHDNGVGPSGEETYTTYQVKNTDLVLIRARMGPSSPYFLAYWDTTQPYGFTRIGVERLGDKTFMNNRYILVTDYFAGKRLGVYAFDLQTQQKYLLMNDINIQTVANDFVKKSETEVQFSNFGQTEIFDFSTLSKRKFKHYSSFSNFANFNYYEPSTETFFVEVSAGFSASQLFFVGKNGRTGGEISDTIPLYGRVDSPKISPFASKIFFRDAKGSNGPFKMVGMNLDGTNPEVIVDTEDAQLVDGPVGYDLSENGEDMVVAVQKTGGNFEVNHWHLPTNTWTTVSTDSFPTYEPALEVSPNGDYLVMDTDTPGFLIKNLTDASPVIYIGAPQAFPLHFSADSSTFFYNFYNGASWDLYSAPVSNPTSPTNLTAGLTLNYNPFAEFKNNHIYLRVRDSGFRNDLYRVDYLGNDELLYDCTGTSRSISSYHVNSDETKLVFFGDVDTNNRTSVYVMNSDGSSPQRIQEYLHNSNPSWTKFDDQESYFYYYGNFEDSGIDEVFRFKLDGTGYEKVSPNLTSLQVASKHLVSLVNRKIYFVGNLLDPENFEVLSVNLDGTGLARAHSGVLEGLSNVHDIRLSTNEEALYVSGNRQGETETRVFQIFLE